MMDQPDVAWGRYPVAFDGTTAWLLPNPSGLNKSFSLEALVEAYCELRAALRAGHCELQVAVTDDWVKTQSRSAAIDPKPPSISRTVVG
jgi:hypothetical protein